MEPVKPGHVGPRPDVKAYHDGVFPELTFNRDAERVTLPIFPDRCPGCGAQVETARDLGTEFAYVKYGCGGDYAAKAQIQRHTGKFWGLCPVKRAQFDEAEGDAIGKALASGNVEREPKPIRVAVTTWAALDLACARLLRIVDAYNPKCETMGAGFKAELLAAIRDTQTALAAVAKGDA